MLKRQDQRTILNRINHFRIKYELSWVGTEHKLEKIMKNREKPSMVELKTT